MTNYFPTKNDDFKGWLANFVTIARANIAALGLVASDFTPISTKKI